MTQPEHSPLTALLCAHTWISTLTWVHASLQTWSANLLPPLLPSQALPFLAASSSPFPKPRWLAWAGMKIGKGGVPAVTGWGTEECTKG